MRFPWSDVRMWFNRVVLPDLHVNKTPAQQERLSVSCSRLTLDATVPPTPVKSVPSKARPRKAVMTAPGCARPRRWRRFRQQRQEPPTAQQWWRYPRGKQYVTKCMAFVQLHLALELRRSSDRVAETAAVFAATEWKSKPV
jgi:hypothetical protein